MKVRQKIKRDEERIRKLIHAKGQPGIIGIRAWNRTVDYYSTNDYLEGHNHVAILKYIYLDRYSKNDTGYGMSWKNYVSERTLYRYRKKYISCFRRFYKEELARGGGPQSA